MYIYIDNLPQIPAVQYNLVFQSNRIELARAHTTYSQQQSQHRQAMTSFDEIEKAILQVSIIFFLSPLTLSLSISLLLSTNLRVQSEAHVPQRRRGFIWNSSPMNSKSFNSRFNNSNFNLFDVCVLQVWFICVKMDSSAQSSPIYWSARSFSLVISTLQIDELKSNKLLSINLFKM